MVPELDCFLAEVLLPNKVTSVLADHVLLFFFLRYPFHKDIFCIFIIAKHTSTSCIFNILSATSDFTLGKTEVKEGQTPIGKILHPRDYSNS